MWHTYVKLDYEIHFGDSILFSHKKNDVIHYELLYRAVAFDNENDFSLSDLVQGEKVSSFDRELISSSFSQKKNELSTL